MRKNPLANVQSACNFHTNYWNYIKRVTCVTHFFDSFFFHLQMHKTGVSIIQIQSKVQWQYPFGLILTYTWKEFGYMHFNDGLFFSFVLHRQNSFSYVFSLSQCVILNGLPFHFNVYLNLNSCIFWCLHYWNTFVLVMLRMEHLYCNEICLKFILCNPCMDTWIHYLIKSPLVFFISFTKIKIQSFFFESLHCPILFVNM